MEANDTKETVEKTEFTMKGDWGMDVMIKEIPYYVWMKQAKVQNPHKIDTKLAYLKEIGFNKEIHKLANSTEILKIMGYCEDMYYQWEILAKSKNPIDKA